MIFYDVPTNTNGKISQEVYVNRILEPMVKSWIERGDSFILEGDGDSGHGKRGVNSIATRWKEDNNLLYYANCPHSLDLSPIENAWQVPKQFIGKKPHWDDKTCIEAIKKGWANLDQKTINKCVEEMPQRLQDIMNSRGKMTKH